MIANEWAIGLTEDDYDAILEDIGACGKLHAKLVAKLEACRNDARRKGVFTPHAHEHGVRLLD